METKEETVEEKVIDNAGEKQAQSTCTTEVVVDREGKCWTEVIDKGADSPEERVKPVVSQVLVTKPVKNDARNQEALTLQKHKLLNMCVLGFVAVITFVTFITFFVAVGRGNGFEYYIASIYVLCMLLAAPTLKVFLDKVTCPLMRKLNIIGIIVIFSVILLLVVTVVSVLAAQSSIF